MALIDYVHGKMPVVYSEPDPGTPIETPPGATVYERRFTPGKFARILLKFWPDYSGPRFESWIVGRRDNGALYAYFHEYTDPNKPLATI